MVKLGKQGSLPLTQPHTIRLFNLHHTDDDDDADDDDDDDDDHDDDHDYCYHYYYSITVYYSSKKWRCSSHFQRYNFFSPSFLGHFLV